MKMRIFNSFVEVLLISIIIIISKLVLDKIIIIHKIILMMNLHKEIAKSWILVEWKVYSILKIITIIAIIFHFII